MSRRIVNLIIIFVVLAAVIWVDLPSNPGIKIGDFSRSLKTVLGLDLRGGMQVLLEVDLPADSPVTSQNMADARAILENRSNGLGVSEVVFQVAGTRRIVGEFPGLTNSDEVVAVLKETGNLEFVDMGDTPGNEGDTLVTDFLANGTIAPTAIPTLFLTPTVPPSPTPPGTPTPAGTPAPTAAPTAVPTATGTPAPKVWHTIMNGAELKSVGVGTDNLGNYVINFELNPTGSKIFADYTSNNVGKFLAIVLDKKIISVPSIHSAITEGSGEITGKFTLESAMPWLFSFDTAHYPSP
jgi:preprotein translocase subunit SecD